MKYAEINRRYTEVVAGYIAAGYIINTATMPGSQGEVAHTDLTDGHEIIRIVLESFHEWNWQEGYDYEGFKILVGRCTDDIRPNDPIDYRTLWNSHLEEVSCEYFYEINKHWNPYKWYGTKEEADAADRIAKERSKAREVQTDKIFDESAKKVVHSFIKRQDRCKSVRVADIDSVHKELDDKDRDGKRYFVLAKGTRYWLH